ncbi:hypothetical protein PR202_gb24282 [Eleusine coracana subsp. coracana]|uniref:DUF1618 domain-containing protein n=1 Tax=Eleusine coracana subsp. coracana TaxID=191504 RepID=A0AAV5FIA6_ELECO|nr:hypothetical protein PR202_gb24282 [Eleusine coracana subsp. coracana]
MAHCIGRVDGSLYLGMECGIVIVLDNTSLEFFQVDLPSGIHMSEDLGYHSTYNVVHGVAGDSEPRSRPRIIHVYLDELEVFRRVFDSGEWVLEHSIRRLSEVTRGLPGYPREKAFDWEARVFDDGIGFVVVSVWDPNNRKWLFSVDMETMELKVVPESDYRNTRGTWSYTLSWSPFIRASPRVKLI